MEKEKDNGFVLGFWDLKIHLQNQISFNKSHIYPTRSYLLVLLILSPVTRHSNTWDNGDHFYSSNRKPDCKYRDIEVWLMNYNQVRFMMNQSFLSLASTMWVATHDHIFHAMMVTIFSQTMSGDKSFLF